MAGMTGERFCASVSAVCTPSRKNAQPKEGDGLIWNSPAADGSGGWRKVAVVLAHQKRRDRDGRGRRVFVAEQFYFGNERVAIPETLRSVIRNGQRLEITNGDLARAFVKWLEASYAAGIHGMPRTSTTNRDQMAR